MPSASSQSVDDEHALGYEPDARLLFELRAQAVEVVLLSPLLSSLLSSSSSLSLGQVADNSALSGYESYGASKVRYNVSQHMQSPGLSLI